MEDIVHQVQIMFKENSFWAWVALAGVAAVMATIVKLVLTLIAASLRKLAERTASPWDDLGVDLIRRFKTWILFVVLFFVLTRTLNQPEGVRRALLILMVVAVIFQVASWGLHAIRTWQDIVLTKRTAEDPSSSAALGLLSTAIQGVFLIVLVLIGLSNLGVDVTALVAGLGVGGIAVALAAQNVLGDLLASLSIVLDKPFVIGDMIVAGQHRGTVEHIGIKTTRLRSISGEELVVSNKDLLESRVENYKRMSTRRVVHKLGVVYSTPADVLEQIPVWIRAIIESEPKVLFERCHFSAFGASSLDFEVVFHIQDADYLSYMDNQQIVLMGIFRKFADEGVEFAFPTQSLYVEKLPAVLPTESPTTARS